MVRAPLVRLVVAAARFARNPDGKSTAFGRLRCTGISCRSETGRGFTVSVEKQRVF